MIITDKSLTPAKRFMEVIKEYFESKEYQYKKSERAFIKKDDLGFTKINIHFTSHFSIVLATIHWERSFLNFEKIFANIAGNKKYKTETTFCVNISNYIPKQEAATNILCPLFDPETSLYDDFSLNSASEKIMRLYEIYAIPFFQKYNSYNSVYEEIIKLPLGQAQDFIIRYDKLPALGLMLANYYNYPHFEILKHSYYELANNVNIMIRDKMLAMINKVLIFIGENDVKKLL